MIALNPSLIFCLLSCIHEAKSGWRVNWPLAVWAMYCVAHPNDFTCQWRKLKTWWEGKIQSFWKVKTWWEREIPNWEGKDSREGKGPKQKGKILNPSMSFLFTHETAQNLWPFSYHACILFQSRCSLQKSAVGSQLWREQASTLSRLQPQSHYFFDEKLSAQAKLIQNEKNWLSD